MSTENQFSVAPMMDWTDRHCRFFHRLLTRRALLYTEMLTTGAVIHGDRQRLLGFNPDEQPLALQLGGSCANDLAQAAEIGQRFGYQEINLNVGCPSDRVKSGRFGACLMAEPNLVAQGVAAMRAAVDVPVTVKTRIGIDDRDSYEHLRHFIDSVAAVGCQRFIIHARKAWLNGLSPKQNRELPPLRYDVVYRLKQDYPQLTIIINGGITDLDQAVAHLRFVDGVMLGRAAYQTPALLAAVDQRLFAATTPSPDPIAVIRALQTYADHQLSRGVRLHAISRHVLGLFQGRPGARAWRRHLSQHACQAGAAATVLDDALAHLAPQPVASEIPVCADLAH